MDLARKNSNN